MKIQGYSEQSCNNTLTGGSIQTMHPLAGGACRTDHHDHRPARFHPRPNEPMPSRPLRAVNGDAGPELLQRSQHRTGRQMTTATPAECLRCALPRCDTVASKRRGCLPCGIPPSKARTIDEAAADHERFIFDAARRIAARRKKSGRRPGAANTNGHIPATGGSERRQRRSLPKAKVA
jgi:hypothetical protein